MFVHCYDEKTYNELEKKGAIPLKKDFPYILMVEDVTVFNFSDIDKNKYEIKDCMYF